VDYQKLGYTARLLDEDGIEKGKRTLVAATKTTMIPIDTFQQAGLKVDVLEIRSRKILRTIREQLLQFSSQEAAMLVDIEFDNTEIAIVVDGVPAIYADSTSRQYINSKCALTRNLRI